MPELGEIKKASLVGYKNNHKVIWSACRVCGKSRWRVYVVKHNKATSDRCQSCALKQHIKGLAIKGRNNYNWKGGKNKTNKGYIKVKLELADFFYPMVEKDDYILEHRLVMAKSLGRNLHRWEIVHHKNHIKDDNRIENLQLVSDDRHLQITILERRIDFLEAKIEEQNKFIKLVQFQLMEKLNVSR